MQSKYIVDRATALVEAASVERQPSLVRTLQQSRSDMVARGMYTSSTYVLEIIEACASELRERAKVIWECIQRAHKSCDSKVSEDLPGLFRTLLEKERANIEKMQEVMSGDVVRQLQNRSLLPVEMVAETHEILLVQYKTEIAMYLDDLKRGTGKNLFEQLKNNFLNNKLVAAVAIALLVISLLTSFTENFAKLSKFIGSLIQ